MPGQQLTAITYAASASLATIALVYIFAPNFLFDGEGSASSASMRKKSVVGLSNPANDCFINSVLQSLAGLGELRLYLIRELHRRKLDGPEVYKSLPDKEKDGKSASTGKLLSLQKGEVTQGLKDMIDGLNERPIYRKTISAANFIAVLERAFGTRISKSQQDAQELLQIVAERLSEEYHAGKGARNRAEKRLSQQGAKLAIGSTGLGVSIDDSMSASFQMPQSSHSAGEKRPHRQELRLAEEDDGFPLEGQTESQIECQFCHFVPKTNPVSFVMLTLAVPQKGSTTLIECFDGHFKTEYIDDYKCDKCRLEHALALLVKDLARTTSKRVRADIQSEISKIQKAIAEDPEKPPQDVKLPDSKLAPMRRITRHVKITLFPKILVIHLSRSIYDPRSSSTKNAAKVSFPEKLPIGSLLDRRNYKLLGMVGHKGTHNSGHYESFRRQHLYAPFSTPTLRNIKSPSSFTSTPDLSIDPSPRIPSKPSIPPEASEDLGTIPDAPEPHSPSVISSTPSLSSDPLSTPSTRPSSGSLDGSLISKQPSSGAITIGPGDSEQTLKPPVGHSTPSSTEIRGGTSTPSSTEIRGGTSTNEDKSRRRRKSSDRWWRISDDKVKECKTGDVLAMQKEVYMLFYEIERG